MTMTDAETGLAPTAALGRRVTAFEGFDTFTAPRRGQRITLESSEVTALCPVTGQPDWYTVAITYAARDRCLESKTAKLYFHSFRNEGVFCEALAARIFDDIRAALDPLDLEVDVRQTPRGGVGLRAILAGHWDAEEADDASR